MSTRIVEFHGAPPLSAQSRANAANRSCPFIDGTCKKKRSGGACMLAPLGGEPVIICPNRLYANQYGVIQLVAQDCFGADAELVTDIVAEERRRTSALSGNEVVVYGQGYSGEIGIRAPSEEGGADGSFKIDYILTRVDEDLNPISFVAIEVQTIDTTNSYSSISKSYYEAEDGIDFASFSHETSAGFNWENVSKRILPQIIYKGHALRREVRAQFGLYFIIPHPVFEKIKTRIGGRLLEYPRGPGTVTFQSYGLGTAVADGPRSIHMQETFTTTVEQIAFAFVSPQNLPPLGVYEENLREKLQSLRRKKTKKEKNGAVTLEFLLDPAFD